jgi:hypothetical protein
MATLEECLKTLEESELKECVNTVVKMLEHKMERLEKIKTRLLELLSGEYGVDTIAEELDWIIGDICDEFRNCETCPLKRICDMALKSCDEMYNCEGCPRLHICLERGILEVNLKEMEE